MFRKIYFKNVLYEWLEYKKNGIKESTYNKYLFRIEKYIMSIIENIEFKKLCSKDIENFFNNDKISMLSDSTKKVFL